MKRYGYITEKVLAFTNYLDAYNGFTKYKKNRKSIQEFDANFIKNIVELMKSFSDGSYRTSEYINSIIHEPKERIISKLPPKDHIQEWAVLLHTENILVNTFIRESCSCVKGRGTHDFIRLLYKTLKNNIEDTTYFVQIDVHHFFPSIQNFIMKDRLRTKIKDEHILKFFDEFIDSYNHGLPLGVKLSQILANFLLAKFDYDAKQHFHILNDPDKLAYYTNRYVTDSFVSCRTKEQADELANGVEYMKNKFISYLTKPLKYFRFADNIIILHKDKTFLHIIKELIILVLARDYYLTVNMNYNVRPVYSGGIDICGYVLFHTHILLRKRNKKNLCKQINRCKKRGMTDEEIRLVCASRIGFASHANTKHLLESLGVKQNINHKTYKKNGIKYSRK